jgi:predicted ThiF/HesA family dinucleotide-utilizing enzyme
MTMQGLDAHNSALWVANERRLDEQSRTQKFIVTVAVEGYVEVEVEATSLDAAHDQAMLSLGDRDWDIVVTEQYVTDSEVVK